jgi:hypothetical protein
LGKKKSRVGGDDNHVAFGKEFHGGKGSVRRCVVAMQQPVVVLPKFRSESCTFSLIRHKTSQ